MARRIAHISDLHFGRDDAAVVEGLAADLYALSPDLLLVSGDLTQRARRREFAMARAFLDRLGLPMLVVPGNHDVPLYNLGRRFFGPLHRYHRAISDVKQPTSIDEAIAVVGLDTARALALSGGRINQAQLAELKRAFVNVPERCIRIVVTHHPLIAPPDRPLMPLVGRAAEAAAAFDSARVDIVLAGHFHDSFAVGLKTQHPAVRRSILVIHAGTATSTRTRAAPNEYNILDLDGADLALTVRRWNGHAFEPLQANCFHRSDDGWTQKDRAPVIDG